MRMEDTDVWAGLDTVLGYVMGVGIFVVVFALVFVAVNLFLNARRGTGIEFTSQMTAIIIGLLLITGAPALASAFYLFIAGR